MSVTTSSDQTSREKIIVQPGTALAQQPWQAGARQLINDLSQIERRTFSLQHGDACAPATAQDHLGTCPR